MTSLLQVCVFLHCTGHVLFSSIIPTGALPPGVDMIDNGGGGGANGGTNSAVVVEEDEEDKCMYVIIDAMDPLQLNVTPQAITVLKDVTEVRFGFLKNKTTTTNFDTVFYHMESRLFGTCFTNKI